MTRSRIWSIGAAVAVIVVLGAAIWWRANASDADADESDDAGAPAADASRPTADVAIPVEGAEAVRGTLTLTVNAAAQSAAWREAVLPSHVTGQVARVTVRENDVVRAGQEIAAIDATEYRMALREAEANLADAQARYRELTLFDDRIADADARAERERIARARSGLDAAQVALERAQLQLSRTVVRAPFGGRVASIEAQPGEWVSAGDPLMRVVDIDPVRVEVQVLDSEVRWLRRGGAAEVQFSALPGEVFAGEVASVNPVVDPELRTAKVTVVVPNADGRVLPGMYARVRLEARQFEDRVLVPRSAILERDRRPMLFVYDGDDRGGLAKWRYVTPGLGNDDVVELLDSDDTETVEPGEIVLTDGHFSLIHDARVRLVDELDATEGARPE
ncbi:MAG TPA: efflux RND transporter periplasmic adaptor subunit [Longimicrobiales bacterium]